MWLSRTYLFKERRIEKERGKEIFNPRKNRDGLEAREGDLLKFIAKDITFSLMAW